MFSVRTALQYCHLGETAAQALAQIGDIDVAGEYDGTVAVAAGIFVGGAVVDDHRMTLGRVRII